ncbi:hypothetical protein PT974_12437 [Cladobotryum mycophilum]|uniref:DUF7580 domain-containing protein n=1 Tax=Cladobotryum mycophilum TaxID=491253 RepID=A0ABR0S7Z4_9HYPO
MSGFEIVGVVLGVLGVLPAAVEALQSYKSLLSSLRNVERDLRALIQDLETEQVRLRTTYKDNGEARHHCRTKACHLFYTKEKDYEDIVTRIKNGNAILHELAGQNSGLEPNGRRRSQARLIKLIRELSQSIFNALRNATTCRCTNSHKVCLELVHRNMVLVPSDLEDQVAKNVIFHVVLGSNDESTYKTCETADEVIPGRLASWNGVHIRLEDLAIEPGLASPPSTLATITSPKRVRKVNWFSSVVSSTKEESASATQTMIDVSKRLAAVPMYTPGLVSNLCQVLFRQQKAPARELYGYISDTDRRFGLYPPQHNLEVGTTVTLRQVLDGQVSNYPQFDYPEKLRVALAVATNVLHLYKTPWLARIVTIDDVIFLHDEGHDTHLSHSSSPYRPFITQSLPKRLDTPPAEAQQHRTFGTPRPINLAVLSLGALLIQIIIGRTIDTLEMTGNTDMNSILSMHETGNQFSDKILENGGINYMATVKWCLESVLGIAGLEDDSFCQNFYVEVVARLEEDVKLLES